MKQALSVESDPFTGLEIPDALQASLSRHRLHLLELIQSLQGAGVSESQIETSVAVIVASYRDELVRAMKAMVR